MRILDGTKDFSLHPDYDAMMAEWANTHPENPDPRFTAAEARMCEFHWPTNVPVGKVRRGRNGKFIKKGS